MLPLSFSSSQSSSKIALNLVSAQAVTSRVSAARGAFAGESVSVSMAGFELLPRPRGDPADFMPFSPSRVDRVTHRPRK